MNNLGLLYKNQNKFDLAEKYYQLAIEKGNSVAIDNLKILKNKNCTIF
jgi:TPR repeat protein